MKQLNLMGEALATASSDSEPAQDMKNGTHAQGVTAQGATALTDKRGGSIAPRAGDRDAAFGAGSGMRYFVPCNREDALLLLSSLGISHLFPGKLIALPVQGPEVAIVEGGLRQSEEALLNNGQPERFPVLVELTPAASELAPRLLEFSHILGLRFHGEKELQDFRFRPIDELDTEALTCTAEPDLFSLAGEPRFSVQLGAEREIPRVGQVADRLVSGVRCLLELGEGRPICWDAIARLLCGNLGPEGAENELGFEDVAAELIMPGSAAALSRHGRTLAEVFPHVEQRGARRIVEDLSKALAKRETDEPSRRSESAWAEKANQVLRNKAALDGELLGDAKAILLRAALLAAVVDEVSQLTKFLDAEKPSGVKVTSIAAFLVGLKKSLVGTSWRQKKGRVAQLSRLLTTIQRGLLKDAPPVSGIFALLVQESEDSTRSAIRWGDDEIANWERRKVVPPDAVQQEWGAAFERLGYKVVRAGATRYSWVVQWSEERQIEVVRVQSGEDVYAVLKFSLGGEWKPKKSKDLVEISQRLELLWRPAKTDEGEVVLHCALLALPDQQGRALVGRRLSEAISLCAVPQKVRKRLRAPGKKRDEESGPQQT